MDITAIPLADASVDLAIASHVLEHIPDDRRAMAELRRVVRPGGAALLMVPMEEGRPTYEDPAITAPADRLRAFGQEDHVRIYGDDFTDRLSAAGFAVRRELYARTLGAEAIARNGLQDYDAIYVCS
jgi:ubiquinone/menaquinone biosynthesis C-methylase UbiE